MADMIYLLVFLIYFLMILYLCVTIFKEWLFITKLSLVLCSTFGLVLMLKSSFSSVIESSLKITYEQVNGYFLLLYGIFTLMCIISLFIEILRISKG